MSSRVYWLSRVPDADDFGEPIDHRFYDGRTHRGPWAIMTPKSHQLHGVGCGTGRGQCYEKQSDGRWLKVDG